MKLSCRWLCIATFFSLTGLSLRIPAQTAATTTPSANPAEAAQFDFLLGQWSLEVKPKVSGLVALIHGVPKYLGTWKAARSADGQGVEDDLRVIDASGNPIRAAHSVRRYDAAQKHWAVSSIDLDTQRRVDASATWSGGEMLVSGSGTDGAGKPYQSRSHFTQITPTSFQMVQDRSFDDGQTWEEATLVIDAKRIATVPSQ